MGYSDTLLETGGTTRVFPRRGLAPALPVSQDPHGVPGPRRFLPVFPPGSGPCFPAQARPGRCIGLSPACQDEAARAASLRGDGRNAAFPEKIGAIDLHRLHEPRKTL